MITLEQARVLLQRAVETQGRDFVYRDGDKDKCFYSVEGFIAHGKRMNIELSPDDPRLKTGCLVGTALDLAGHTEHRHLVTTVSHLAEHVIPMTIGAVRYFSTAQRWQDIGHSWGDAFDQAEVQARYLRHLEGGGVA